MNRLLLTDRNDMDVNASSNAAAMKAFDSVIGVENKRAQLQATLLRKVMDTQQGEASSLLKLFEGKGQNLDIKA